MSWWRESSTYKVIVAEGRVAEARRVLLDLGIQKFGAPDAAVRQTVEELDDLDILGRLIRRVLTASSWQELLVPASLR